MARSYALNYKYKDALNFYYQSHQQLANKNHFDPYSIAYNKINFAITRGYIGRYDESQFEAEVKSHMEVLSDNSDFSNDVISFSLALADVAFNFRFRGISYHIRLLNSLLKENPQSIESSFIYIRLGILNFLKFITSNDKSHLELAYDNFKKEVEVSNTKHFKNYWSKCGMITCASVLGHEIDPNLISDSPYGYRSRIQDFPIIRYFVARAKIITGDISLANKILKDSERKIDLLLNDLDGDLSSQTLMVKKYKILKDEWINLIYTQWENNEIIEAEACKRIIKVNEIFHFRELKEYVTNNFKNQTRNNLSNILANLKSSDKEHIFYLTDRISIVGENDKFYTISIDIRENQYKLNCYDGVCYDEKINTWEKIITQGLVQDECFLFLNNLIDFDTKNENILVVPNQLLINIPFGLMRNQDSFFFEKYKYEYWPSLNIASGLDRRNTLPLSVSIFYDENELNAVSEANMIKTQLKEKCNYSESITNMIPENTNSKILHLICHYDGRNVVIDNNKIPYLELFEKIDLDNKMVILNMCKGGDSKLNNSIYNSLPTFLISMGALTVISHTWDLGQQASKSFTNMFYKGINNTIKVNVAFQQSLKNMNQHNVIEYGGYTLWGNGNLVFK
jgi:CHAT domain-containing protein